MFTGLTTRLHEDIEMFKNVLNAHEHARASYDASPAEPDAWAPIRATNLPRTAWHIYDHCGALTRLYAIYATFVDDLINEYLRNLPNLYPTYDQLPEALSRQHRLGLATILAKLGESGIYGHFEERELIATLSHGLSGGTHYKLVPEAFFTDRQNYRLDVLGRLLGYLGIDHATTQLTQDHSLTKFLETTTPEGTTLASELEQFVKRRNEVAHGHVANVIATDEIKRTADLIAHLGVAVASILAHAVIERQHTLGQLPKIGDAEEIHYGGHVALSHLENCVLRTGERLALVYGGKVMLPTIIGLQRNDVDLESLLVGAREEIGIKFDRKIKRGAAIHALSKEHAVRYQLLQVVEQRRDDIVGLITDKLRELTFRADENVPAELDSVETIELDLGHVQHIEGTHADITIRAHITFAAIIASAESTSQDGTEPTAPVPCGPEQVTGNVSVTVDLRLGFAALTVLTEPEQVSLMVLRVNSDEEIIFSVDQPLDEPTDPSPDGATTNPKT